MPIFNKIGPQILVHHTEFIDFLLLICIVFLSKILIATMVTFIYLKQTRNFYTLEMRTVIICKKHPVCVF